jgi:nucleoside-diphosphate-sugar epimerase
MMKDLLIIGCGDIATRALPRLARHFNITALVRSDEHAARLNTLGVSTRRGDLDDPESLQGLGEGMSHLLHCAPPGPRGELDLRTRNLVKALDAGAQRPPLERLVYVSTSGVYGDCAGALVDESRARVPTSARGRRRADAEEILESWTLHRGISLAILRAPGIYASDRLPLARLRAGTPALRAEDDVYTNHIHADDLAAIVDLALLEPAARGAFNASDDSEIKMADYFDLVADRHHLPRPPRIALAEARGVIPPELLSFMSESRRLVNRRMKSELGVRLAYPTVHDGIPKASSGDEVKALEKCT